MHEQADRLAGGFVTKDEELEREFDLRLVESANLAFRVAFSVLRSREDAEDVAQDVFAKAHRRFRQLREPSCFRSWLVRMVWRMSVDRRRSNRRRLAREAAHESMRVSTSDAGADERAQTLWEAIDALPEKLRTVIVLANIEGHDVAAVAQVLDIPQGTVKSRLFLARQRLKDRLQWMNTTTTKKL